MAGVHGINRIASRISNSRVLLDVKLTETRAEETAMEGKVGVRQLKFNGDGGTPIRHEEIVLRRDVVFLVWDRPYDEEVQSMGAPAIGTFNYTGYLRKREGIYFE